MKGDRREFLRLTGIAGLGMAVNPMDTLGNISTHTTDKNLMNMKNLMLDESDLSLIGLYGRWAASLVDNKIPALSFRQDEFKSVEAWHGRARQCVIDRMAVPDIGGLPEVTLKKQYEYDGLHVEELSWQLPYGRATEAVLLKPLHAKGKLPGILAFHDHGGIKYFGKEKITKISDHQNPIVIRHRKEDYAGIAWANEIAKRGYVVLVHDAFAFSSRRVMLKDVPSFLRHGVAEVNPDNLQSIIAYDNWAGDHEHVMAKSLFCAGTTWPGVFFAEDRKALDILCAREDVDKDRIGCGGLSGGGLRTDFMGGLDPRIKCAVSVGFMSTWRDFLLNKSFTHTWMLYVPLLANYLDFPEILALRVPLPTFVLNNEQDPLYTLPEMQRADKMMNDIYSKANAVSRYKCSYYPGPHKFDKEMQKEAFDWFDKWLKV